MTDNLFKNNNYVIAREALQKEVTAFAYTYFQNKREVAKHLKQSRFISPFDKTWGSWDDPQIPNTYSHYADLVMETILQRLLPTMNHITDMDLVPTYSYARIYKYGDELKRHKDRPSCEISCTLNLGGDPWPIYLDPTGECGNQGAKVDLQPGDILAYRGDMLEHWREPFEGYDCGQVFLHYNQKDGPYGKDNVFDKRPMLGLPVQYKSNYQND